MYDIEGIEQLLLKCGGKRRKKIEISSIKITRTE